MDPLLPIIDLVIMCNNYSIITLIIVYNELVTISNNYVIGLRFAAALLPLLFGTNPRSHHKGATDRVRMETNCFQFYTIANLDKTSLITYVMSWNCIITDMIISNNAATGIIIITVIICSSGVITLYR